MYQKYPGEADLKHLRAHLFKFLHQGLSIHTELRKELGETKGFEGLKAVADKLKELRKDDTPESKLGWYYRHWKGMGLEKDTVATRSMRDWKEQNENDPLVNGELQAQKV